MHKSKLLLLLAPLLATACAVGPSYHQPRLPVEASGAFQTKSADFDTTAALPDDWWQLYRDPALDALIAEAFAANTDLRVASANLVKARAVLTEARTGRLPSTDISGGVSWGDAVPGGGGKLPDTQWAGSASAGLSWEADLFGRVGRAIEASRADAEAVEAARDAVRTTVAAETTRAYFDACSYAFALDIARGSSELSQKSLALLDQQEKAGSAARIDVDRAAAAAATARAAVPAFEAAHRIALLELAALLGKTPDAIPASASACKLPPAPVSALPVGDGTALLRRRPDLREAERRLHADTARIGVVTADLYPRLTFGGSGNFLRSDTQKGSDSFSFSLGPLVSWTFPNIAATRARIRQAQAEGDASLATFDGRVLTALKEVEQAMSAVAAQQQRQEALNDAQERSEAAWKLAVLRYQAGSASALDTLLAQGDLLNARAAYAASVQQLSSDRVDLFKALGGGWQGTNGETATAQLQGGGQ